MEGSFWGEGILGILVVDKSEDDKYEYEYEYMILNCVSHYLVYWFVPLTGMENALLVSVLITTQWQV